MSVPELLQELDACAEEGTLRRLGSAFARFIASLGEAAPCVVLSCAVLSELESRGDTCLPLEDLVEDPCAKLHLSPERCARLHALIGDFPATVAGWKSLLASCRQVYVAGQPDENQPLVLQHDRLYLRRFWLDERFIAQAMAARSQAFRQVDCEQVRSWLDRLFEGPAAGEHDWQKTACAVALRSDVALITGGPGTGKTYTVARLLALLWATAPNPGQLRIALAAPSGKAAIRLKQSIDGALHQLAEKIGPSLDLAVLAARLPAASTLHRLLGVNPHTREVRYHGEYPLDVDVLVVDEASMVHLEMMASVLRALPAHARLVLLGDKDQLSSVEAGAVLGDLCEGAQHGNYDAETAAYVQATCGQTLPAQKQHAGDALAQRTVMLRKSRRFDGPIGQLALAVNDNAGARAQEFLRQASPELHWQEQATLEDLLRLATQGRAGAEGGFAAYLALLQEMPTPYDPATHAQWVRSVLAAFERFRILCAVREGEWGVEAVNHALEQRLRREQRIAPHGEWYAGRPVMVTRNDYHLGLHNGDVGMALPDGGREGRLRVYFQSGAQLASVLPSRLVEIETAFAMTVHKVQGSEFAHTVLALPPHGSAILTRELIYTGITRASQRFTLVTPQAQVFRQGVAQPTVRASGLRQFMRVN